MINIAVIGATGYTGSELIRLLLQHPEIQIQCITSESRTGEKLTDVHPQFHSMCDMTLIKAEDIKNYSLDLVFLALPHRVSMNYIQKWQNEKFKIIDLSGDFRLNNAATYEEWYDKKHIAPALVSQVPYGLPELNNDKIANAKIVANPGCYPTASSLALAPLMATKSIDENQIIIDAKSGATGAGIKSQPTTHFSNVNDNFKAYGLKSHRHTIEIEETLSKLSNSNCTVQFTPHLLPVDRGILTTTYTRPVSHMNDAKLQDLYHEFYQNKPFIRIRNKSPEIKSVRATNFCDIHVTFDERTNRIIALSTIDNLIKGAAGQAIQNMNLMFNLPESTGLLNVPVQP